MRKEGHVQQDIECIGKRHQDCEWRCPWEEHQPASDRLEKANPKDQVPGFLKREHELIELTWRIANRVPIHAEPHRHDPRTKQEECEECSHHEGESWKANAPFF